MKLDAPTVDADGGPDAALTALRQQVRLSASATGFSRVLIPVDSPTFCFSFSLQFPLIFDEAQKNIYKLMKSDSFPRYVRNQLYKEVRRCASLPSGCLCVLLSAPQGGANPSVAVHGLASRCCVLSVCCSPVGVLFGRRVLTRSLLCLCLCARSS